MIVFLYNRSRVLRYKPISIGISFMSSQHLRDTSLLRYTSTLLVPCLHLATCSPIGRRHCLYEFLPTMKVSPPTKLAAACVKIRTPPFTSRSCSSTSNHFSISAYPQSRHRSPKDHSRYPNSTPDPTWSSSPFSWRRLAPQSLPTKILSTRRPFGIVATSANTSGKIAC